MRALSDEVRARARGSSARVLNWSGLGSKLVDMGRWLLLGFGLLLGCAGGTESEPPASGGGPSGAAIDPPTGDYGDGDGDGLCDGTELELGTNPELEDTDGDQLPDLIEAVSNFDPVDDEDPASDQIAFMPGSRGTNLGFAVRSTVDGDGQSLAGWFTAAGSFYRDDMTAADFFVGATAVSADPIDAARSINEESARFAAVLGKTRLAFNLSFEFGDRPDLECGRAYPFRYAIKSDDGETRSERFYLLVVGKNGAAGLDTAAFCIPSTCE